MNDADGFIDMNYPPDAKNCLRLEEESSDLGGCTFLAFIAGLLVCAVIVGWKIG